jgi:hypothetical protein
MDLARVRKRSTLSPSQSVPNGYPEVGSEGESLTTPSESVVSGPRLYRCDAPDGVQRSQVQILPPLLKKVQLRAGFVGHHGPGSDVRRQHGIC